MRDRGVEFERDFSEADRLGVICQRRSRHALIDQGTWDRIPVSRRPVSRLVVRTLVEEVPVRQLLDAEDRVDLLFDGPELPPLSGNDLVEAVRALTADRFGDVTDEKDILDTVRSELPGEVDQQLVCLTVRSVIAARTEGSLPKVAVSFD